MSNFPSRASRESAAAAMDSALTSKCRRRCSRLSLRPKPSVPSVTNRPAQPRRYLVGHNLHVVGSGDDRPFGSVERRQNVRAFLRLGGMQTVPAFGGQRVATQFVVAGHAPDVGWHAVLFGQDILRAQRLIQDGPAAEKLNGCLALTAPTCICKCRAEFLLRSPPAFPAWHSLRCRG